jgi:hypothetical protein
LLALSIVEGHAWGESVKLPFLMDVGVHARFLLALPLLIYAELIVHERMRLVVGAFVKRGLVPDDARGKFEAAIASAMRPRNSIVAEVLLIGFVYGVGVLLIWRSHGAIDVPTWYRMAAAGKLQPTLAGWWFGCVSLPLIQFILLRCISGCSSGRAFFGRCLGSVCGSCPRTPTAPAASDFFPI